ncbi:MAG: hypothetical protein ACI81A_002659, partial [Paraglaciecola sp.]
VKAKRMEIESKIFRVLIIEPFPNRYSVYITYYGDIVT